VQTRKEQAAVDALDLTILAPAVVGTPARPESDRAVLSGMPFLAQRDNLQAQVALPRRSINLGVVLSGNFILFAGPLRTLMEWDAGFPERFLQDFP